MPRPKYSTPQIPRAKRKEEKERETPVEVNNNTNKERGSPIVEINFLGEKRSIDDAFRDVATVQLGAAAIRSQQQYVGEKATYDGVPGALIKYSASAPQVVAANNFRILCEQNNVPYKEKVMSPEPQTVLDLLTVKGGIYSEVAQRLKAQDGKK